MEVVNARAIYSFTPFIVKNKAFNIKRGAEEGIFHFAHHPKNRLDFMSRTTTISFLMIKYNYVDVVVLSLSRV